VECIRCGEPLDAVVPGWCPRCGRAERVGAAALLAWLVDAPTPVHVSDEPHDPDPLAWPGYDELRDAARAATGADEAVTVVRGHVAGTEAVVVAWDFGFLGGSMGTVAGQRIAHAYDTAAAAGLPVVLLPATGGARMQEGMASLAQMAATSAAAAWHHHLQVAVLRDPTTGGVFASHANMADVVLAEPGATIGFAGPRVAEAMTDGPLPSGSHTARGAHAAGLVDAVVPRPDLPRALADLLAFHRGPGATAPGSTTGDDTATARSTSDAPVSEPAADAWAEVQRARATDRARAPAILAEVAVHGRLRGDRAGGTDPAVDVVLATWAGEAVVVVAMDPREGAIGPVGYRTAWRGFDLAARIGVPVVTLVDTPGADAGAGAEAGSVANHIAATLRRLLALPVPTVCVVVGEGGSGGALALAVTDRLLIQQHAIFTVIAPEGAAAILHRDRERAPEVAALLDPTAQRLLALGIADAVVPEPDDPAAAITHVVDAVRRALDDLRGVAPEALVPRRLARWRRPGGRREDRPGGR
jgi:acetyl-CoA carboxylase carboxyl transferase subunit beta